MKTWFFFTLLYPLSYVRLNRFYCLMHFCLCLNLCRLFWVWKIHNKVSFFYLFFCYRQYNYVFQIQNWKILWKKNRWKERNNKSHKKYPEANEYILLFYLECIFYTQNSLLPKISTSKSNFLFIIKPMKCENTKKKTNIQ